MYDAIDTALELFRILDENEQSDLICLALNLASQQ